MDIRTLLPYIRIHCTGRCGGGIGDDLLLLLLVVVDVRRVRPVVRFGVVVRRFPVFAVAVVVVVLEDGIAVRFDLCEIRVLLRCGSSLLRNVDDDGGWPFGTVRGTNNFPRRTCSE